MDSEEDSSSSEEEEVVEEEEEDWEEEEEEEEIEVTPEMEARLYAEFRATARERLMPAVTLAESCKNFGYHPPEPPFEIINHPGRSSSSIEIGGSC